MEVHVQQGMIGELDAITQVRACASSAVRLIKFGAT
jgi:hypothetical protein